MDTIRKALEEVEARRKELRLSTRHAAERTGMSEANWRQLIAGQVRQSGRMVQRMARPDQVLVMGAAVGVLERVAELIGADAAQVAKARESVLIRDPAEEEIMSSRHLSSTEKLILLESLQRARAESED